MKRRQFIKKAAPLTALPFVINGLSFKAYGTSGLLNALAKAGSETDRVLVLIQLNGGNDGLNTVIPLDQYSNLSNARNNILIADSKVLKLYNSTVTGFHPAMTGFHNMYNDGKVTVIQSVGYPNPNFSHFRSTDIWLTASDSDETLYSGWLGRYLDEEYPNYPDDYPNADMPDPLALQIGSIVSPALHGHDVNMGMAISNPTDFYQLITGTTDTAPNTPAGHELTYIRQVSQQTNEYATVIKAAAAKATNKSTKYPTGRANSLADQLKIVAQLIAGGLKTRIYIVNQNGYDTHSAQVDATAGTDKGSHANLLGSLSTAIDAFQDDIKLLGIEDRVLGMTFSEFGRRIKSNGSLGTDHGSAAPLFLFGSKVKSGILGTNPQIPASVTVNDNIPMQYDFRSVYATVLKEWFGVSQEELDKVMLKNFQTLNLMEGTVSVTENPYNTLPENALTLIYPNPFTTSARIRFKSNGTYLQMKVFDSQGKEIKTLVDNKVQIGEHEIILEAESNMRSGTYYIRMQQGNGQVVKPLQLIR